MPSSILSLSSALSFLLLAETTSAFSTTRFNSNSIRKTNLFYRSIHHGPDVEPLTDVEKYGAEYTKMSKDLITNYGPGVLDGFSDNDDQFDGGDSEMGLTGDGSIGLKKVGRYVMLM